MFKKNDKRSRRRNGYNLIIENEEEKNIPTLAEAKLAYKVIFDRLSQSKDFSENDLEALTKIENSLNRNIDITRTVTFSYSLSRFLCKSEIKISTFDLDTAEKNV